jgi:hypothetical protein
MESKGSLGVIFSHNWFSISHGVLEDFTEEQQKHEIPL